MSNDDTRDDATVKLPDDDSKYDTKPGITAVLERINLLDEQLRAYIHRSSADLKADLISEIKSPARKIDILNKELLSVKAEQSRLEDRFDDFEKKPS